MLQALLALYPFKQLYIADINAIQKNGNHNKIILEISAKFPALSLWLDAGVNNINSAKSCQESKLNTVLGSESIEDAAQYQALLSASQHQAILSLDYKNDIYQGASELLNNPNLWPSKVIVMTLNKVGSSAGPDIQKLQSIKCLSKHSSIYAAGGVSNINDLESLSALGIEGALISTALHNGTLTNDHIAHFQK